MEVADGGSCGVSIVGDGVGRTKVGGKVGLNLKLNFNVQQVNVSCDHVHT